MERHSFRSVEGLIFQTRSHFRFVLIAFHAFGLGIAMLHLVLLRASVFLLHGLVVRVVNARCFFLLSLDLSSGHAETEYGDM